jgi:cytoskeletal protein CcmA (bactofilin family)
VFNRQRPATAASPAAREVTPPLIASTAQSNAHAPEPTTDERVGPTVGSRPSTIIAEDALIEGDVTGIELQINGAVKGDVRVDHVSIGEAGSVDGRIYAEAVEVRGKVVGSITAKQVRLKSGCHVDGDIAHEQLSMEMGASFEGNSLRLQRQAPAAPKAETRRADNEARMAAEPAAVIARAGVMGEPILAASPAVANTIREPLPHLSR